MPQRTITPMSPRSLAVTALTLASLPVAAGAMLWNGVLRSRSLWLDLDPFEIDLELRARNDD